MEREKVIKGLECCLALKGDYCDNCPYSLNEWECDKEQLKKDALELLKKQEPVNPILQSGGNYVCGNCGMYTVGFAHPLTGESVQTWKYCGSCGKKVRWDA